MPIVLAAFVLALLGPVFAPPAPDRVSEFGRYEGYSIERFDGWATTSQYVAMRDGVRLAVDVTRPTRDGVVHAKSLPVVWTHSRYHRNPSQLARIFGGDGEGIDSMVDTRPDLQRLVRHGYVVAAVGVRGSGASFGRYEGLFSEAETADAAELCAWFAAQPWCDGNVGMWGGSYLGITQYMAASQAPPSLKAIFPDVAAFDMYDLVYPGGVYRRDMIEHWSTLTRQLDGAWPAPLVDGDEDGTLRAAAIAEHADNWDVGAEYAAAPFRDHDAPSLAWRRHGPSGVLPAIRGASVPAYHFNAWFDVFVTDATLWYANSTGPQHLAIGPWAHGGVPDSAIMAERARLTEIEQHRWFDRWLKGIDNGIDREPSVHYAVMIDPGAWAWLSSDAWPIPETKPVRLALDEGPSGTIASLNDGGLRRDGGRAGADHAVVDVAVTTGTSTRWDNAVGAAPFMLYPALDGHNRAALTYTTPALERDLLVVGHPIVAFFATATSDDVAFHVLLEEIDADGGVHYVTEGVLRAGFRSRSEAPWNNLGLPYQRCFEEDWAPMPRERPAEIVMDLHPTATIFNRGHRIRLVIAGADADNTEPVPGAEGAQFTIHRGAPWNSALELPVVRPGP